MEGIMQEFPTVFDRQIRVMEGEEVYLLLVEDGIPFCVKTL